MCKCFVFCIGYLSLVFVLFFFVFVILMVSVGFVGFVWSVIQVAPSVSYVVIK